MTYVRDRLDHAFVDAVIDDIANELPVDLEIVNWQVLEVGKGRQAAAESLLTGGQQ